MMMMILSRRRKKIAGRILVLSLMTTTTMMTIVTESLHEEMILGVVHHYHSPNHDDDEGRHDYDSCRCRRCCCRCCPLHLDYRFLRLDPTYTTFHSMIQIVEPNGRHSWLIRWRSPPLRRWIAPGWHGTYSLWRSCHPPSCPWHG